MPVPSRSPIQARQAKSRLGGDDLRGTRRWSQLISERSCVPFQLRPASTRSRASRGHRSGWPLRVCQAACSPACSATIWVGSKATAWKPWSCLQPCSRSFRTVSTSSGKTTGRGKARHGLPPPHDNVILPHSALHDLQACSDHCLRGVQDRGAG